MNGNNFLLDTNTILYLLSGDLALAKLLQDESLYTSIITEMELLSYKKLTAKDLLHIKRFLSEVEILGLSVKIKNRAIQVKRSSNLKLPDSIIAATASERNLVLVTADKQFKAVHELNLLLLDKG
jgi:predicted nucleic acid-binding protein